MLVRLFAAAAAAAGCEETTSSAASLADLREDLVARFEGLAEVLSQCSYFVDGVRYAPLADLELAGTQTVDVLPPFAGG